MSPEGVWLVVNLVLMLGMVTGVVLMPVVVIYVLVRIASALERLADQRSK